MKKRILAAAVMLFVLATQLAFAEVEKEYTFTTTDADYAMKTVADIGKGEMKDIPKQIKAGWFKVSEASGITYTLKRKVEPEEVVYENLLDKKLPEGSEKIEKDGKVLKLADTKWESSGRTALTGTRTIKGSDEQPIFPETKEVSASLSDGTVITATCRLKSVQQSGSSYAKPFTVTARFVGEPDVDYYEFGGKEIPNNPSSPAFEGYESAILKALGLNPNSYKINSGKWTSDYKEENGNTVRYAEFSGLRKAKDWTAYYEEELTESSPNLEVYTATCKYGSKETVYTITAKVSYEKSRFTTLGIITTSCVGIVAIAALLAVLFLRLKRKKNNSDDVK